MIESRIVISQSMVAPRVGAWIEIAKFSRLFLCAFVVPPCEVWDIFDEYEMKTWKDAQQIEEVRKANAFLEVDILIRL